MRFLIYALISVLCSLVVYIVLSKKLDVSREKLEREVRKSYTSSVAVSGKSVTIHKGSRDPP